MKLPEDKRPEPPSTASDLAEYLFRNYESLLNNDERAAYRTLIEGRLCGPEAIVDSLLAEGELPFYNRVTQRIMTFHRDKIILSRCPKCNSLCKTPKARLCLNRECNHRWF